MDLEKAVLEYQSMLALPQAESKNRRSVENWFNGNKPLVRSESGCFMGGLEDEDYVALKAGQTDSAGLEDLLDIAVKAFPRIARYVGTPNLQKVWPQLTLKSKDIF